MTTAKTSYRARYQPLPAGVSVAPFPYGYYYGMSDEAVTEFALRQLEHLLHSQSAPKETAAMVVEPVLGEGGYVPAPPEFLQGLRDICDEHGILLVLDEVQSGFGRTGKFFCCEYASVRPDILIMAKGMASGFPFSGIAANKQLMSRWQPGAHGGTYSGNAMGCAAALATIQVIQEEGLIENTAARGKQLIEGLRDLQRRYPVLGDVRGLGLMVGWEFTDPATGEPDAAAVKRVVQHAREDGNLLLLTCGTYGNTIRWIPPLIVTEAQIDEGLATFENALDTLKA